MSEAIWPSGFVPRLVVFDKDGTLIDFNYMWAAWATDLARRLDAASGRSLSHILFRSFGFDPLSYTVDPHGPLAIWSMAALQRLLLDVVLEGGISISLADAVVGRAWYLPDPVTLARPLADLPRVFRTLVAGGAKCAVATSDDRAAAIATLEGLGIAQYAAAVVGADDGLPIKPAPDTVLHLCDALGIAPADTVVVGDAVADLEMGRSARVGLVVGVLSGVSTREILAPYADLVISTVGELV